MKWCKINKQTIKMTKWMTKIIWYQKKEALKKETNMDACCQEQAFISYLTAKSSISWDYWMIIGKNAARRWIWLRPEEQLWNLRIWKTRKCSGNFKIWNKRKNRSLLLLNLPKEHNFWSFHQRGTTTWAIMKPQRTYLLKSLKKNIYLRFNNFTKESERNIP